MDKTRLIAGRKYMYDLQRADMWKRISAWLFDFIIIGILTVGLAFAMSAILKYDSHWTSLEAGYNKYAAEFGVDLDISSEDYMNLSEDEMQKYMAAEAAIQGDAEINYHYNMVVNLSLIITVFSILISHLIVEFAVPLFLGNGQTLGKKIFGVGVMRIDGIKVSPVIMFVRAILGKCTTETLIPIAIVIMLLFNIMDIFGVLCLFGLLLTQAGLVVFTRARTPIHDVLAHTVTVDMASQMIFDSAEELIAYKQRIHQEEVRDMREESGVINTESK